VKLGVHVEWVWVWACHGCTVSVGVLWVWVGGGVVLWVCAPIGVQSVCVKWVYVGIACVCVCV